MYASITVDKKPFEAVIPCYVHFLPPAELYIIPALGQFSKVVLYALLDIIISSKGVTVHSTFFASIALGTVVDANEKHTPLFSIY